MADETQLPTEVQQALKNDAANLLHLINNHHELIQVNQLLHIRLTKYKNSVSK